MRLGDFVDGGFPLPSSPIYDGVSMGDLVRGGFPLPQNPVYFPSVNGSLPKAPDMTRADLNMESVGDDCGAGMGCRGTCGGSCGMGALDLSSISNIFPGETFGIPNTYLLGGVVAALILFSMSGSRRRR